MTNFSLYRLVKGDYATDIVFVAQDTLPNELPITTPFTFAFQEQKVMLAFDKNAWWNPIGGHIEPRETWQDALYREAREEAGVHIDQIQIVGYLMATQVSGKADPAYPPTAILPVTISNIVSIDSAWTPNETTRRLLMDATEAKAVLSQRNDNNQMLEVYNFIHERYF